MDNGRSSWGYMLYLSRPKLSKYSLDILVLLPWHVQYTATGKEQTHFWKCIDRYPRVGKMRKLKLDKYCCWLRFVGCRSHHVKQGFELIIISCFFVLKCEHYVPTWKNPSPIYPMYSIYEKKFPDWAFLNTRNPLFLSLCWLTHCPLWKTFHHWYFPSWSADLYHHIFVNVIRWKPWDLSDKPSLVHVIALCLQASSNYLNLCWPSSILPYVVTRPQAVDHLALNK